ncbi:PAS domain S-box protein [Mucilaginibacter auburnensis]|uniref:histidine kinase n=1 Tax=Mucilaginibacter auburnensis TaxID=1457233 RepID=A0A2H9VVN4_9SPHI|nr:PAS domain S-box protein [Mucilaginibacter auburnensis]PJJ84880.1 PAS domain S-box-containing protein [Mucilaginibacter auburnensis]
MFNTKKLKILHLEDLPTDAELINRTLQRSGLVYDRLLVDNKVDYVRALSDFNPDIILSDHSLPSFNSFEALSLLKESRLNVPFILITATISEEFAVDVMKAGATDYILKDRTQRLPSAITNALEKFQLESEHHKAIAQQTAILNALAPNITLLNEQGKIVAVNESWRKSALLNNLGMPNYGVGYSYIAIAEKANAVDKETASTIAEGIKDVISGKKSEFTLEFKSNLPNNKKWFQLVVAQLINSEEKGAVILHIDITDRKLAEQSLVKSEANLRSVFENTDLGIVLLDEQGKVISFNTNAKFSMQNHFGKKLKVGANGVNYFPQNRRADIKRAIERANHGEVVNYETVYELADGNTEWYEVRWRKVFDESVQSPGVILTFKNITEKKNQEKQNNKITADLVQRNKDLEQFAYIVSHNLRAPVANIKGLLNLNAINPDDSDGIETLNALKTSVNNLDRVIADLNQVLQVSSQFNQKRELVVLSELVEEIKSSISQTVLKTRVRISCNFSKIDSIFTLKSYMHSIFQNLIINSIKYSKPDVDPVINIHSEVDGKTISMVFADNGKGIDLNKHGQSIFGLYKRFDSSVEGKGMGLFMVKSQVESLRGTIRVQSEVNNGTHFIINLPLGE